MLFLVSLFLIYICFGLTFANISQLYICWMDVSHVEVILSSTLERLLQWVLLNPMTSSRAQFKKRFTNHGLKGVFKRSLCSHMFYFGRIVVGSIGFNSSPIRLAATPAVFCVTADSSTSKSDFPYPVPTSDAFGSKGTLFSLCSDAPDKPGLYARRSFPPLNFSSPQCLPVLLLFPSWSRDSVIKDWGICLSDSSFEAPHVWFS